MTKEQELIDTLNKITLGKEKFMEDLKIDFIKIIQEKLTKLGWDATFRYIREQRKDRARTILGSRLNHLYNTCFQKMWSLNNETTNKE